MSSLTHRKSYRISSVKNACETDLHCKSLPDLRGARKRKFISLFRSFTKSRPDFIPSCHVYRQSEWKVFTFQLTLPNGSKHRIIGQGDCTVGKLVRPIIDRLSLNHNYELCLARNSGSVDLEGKACNLENEEIILRTFDSKEKAAKELATNNNNNNSLITDASYESLDYGQQVCKDDKGNLLGETETEKITLLRPSLISQINHNYQPDFVHVQRSDFDLPVQTMPKSSIFGPASIDSYHQTSSTSSSSTHRKWVRILASRVLLTSLKHSERPLSISCDQLDVLKQSQNHSDSLKASQPAIADLEPISQYENHVCQLVSINAPENSSLAEAEHWDGVNGKILRVNKEFLNKESRIDMTRLLTPTNSSKCLNGSSSSGKSNKDGKKSRRTTINWPFRKSSSSKSDPSLNNAFSSTPTTTSPSTVINCKLRKLFTSDSSLCREDNTLIPPVMNLLKQLYLKGPGTVGIFRKSANARICRELKMKLEEDSNLDLSDYPVTAIASLFKEILRSIPGGLLESRYFDDWMAAVNEEGNDEKNIRIIKLLDQLKPSNLILLKYFICVLWHIAKQANENKMCSMNLAVCIGPSVFADNNQMLKRCEEVSKLVPKLVAHMIDHCHDLFSPSITTLFGPAKDLEKQDSGAEESDSLNSLQGGINSNGPAVHNKRDDESIESFDRIMVEESPSSGSRGSPCKRLSSPSENKMSLSNLSQDSGLTLSDTQLYNPDDGDSESSDHCPPIASSKFPAHLTKSVPDLDASNYEDAINVTFSYGRSVGVSIDGSCHDVVRKRRHHDSYVRHRINQINMNMHNYGGTDHRSIDSHDDTPSLNCSSGPSSYTPSCTISGLQQPRSLQITRSYSSVPTHPSLTKSLPRLAPDKMIDVSSYSHDMQTGLSVVGMKSSTTSSACKDALWEQSEPVSYDPILQGDRYILKNLKSFSGPPPYNSHVLHHRPSPLHMAKSHSSGVLPSNSLSPLSSLPSHSNYSSLNKSVPDLDANRDDSLNVTLSYGRSVGVSIDGSCHDVVRKRRHHDPISRGRLSQINSVHSIAHLNGPPPYSCHVNGEQKPLQISKLHTSSSSSLSQTIDEETENCNASKYVGSKYLRNGTRYRHRRPPLAAVLLVCSLGQESYV